VWIRTITTEWMQRLYRPLWYQRYFNFIILVKGTVSWDFNVFVFLAPTSYVFIPYRIKFVFNFWVWFHAVLLNLRFIARCDLYLTPNVGSDTQRSYTNTLLEIESEIPIYRTSRRCFIRPYELAFSFVYGNFPSRISVYKWKFSSQICKRILQDLNFLPYA
jgi:hypothetical protein